MKIFKVTFTVDGKRTEQNVSATGASVAKNLVVNQYSNSRVVIINVQDITTGWYC